MRLALAVIRQRRGAPKGTALSRCEEARFAAASWARQDLMQVLFSVAKGRCDDSRAGGWARYTPNHRQFQRFPQASGQYPCNVVGTKYEIIHCSIGLCNCSDNRWVHPTVFCGKGSNRKFKSEGYRNKTDDASHESSSRDLEHSS